jgi:hypothetical protein
MIRTKRYKEKFKEVITGDLTVSGDDAIRIHLERGRPDKLDVNFVDEQDAPIPCSPTFTDEVKAELIDSNRRVYLMIDWTVSSTRKIVWKLYYR